MLRTIVYLSLLCICISSCSEEPVNNVKATDKRAIELVAFGMSHNPTDENKGFGLAYYCRIDLESDSVFIQKRIGSFESSQFSAWAGTIKGISQNQKLSNFIQSSKQTKNGNIVSTLPNGKYFYDGYNYYSSYRRGSTDKFHFYTSSKLDAKFEEGVEYMMALYQHEKLETVNSFVNTDSMIVQLVNRPAFNKGRLLPPPIRAKVN